MKSLIAASGAVVVLVAGCSSGESLEGLFVAAEPQPCVGAPSDCVQQSLRLFRDDRLWEGGVDRTGQGEDVLAWRLGPFLVTRSATVLVITGQGLSERRLSYKFVDGRLVTGDGNGWVRLPLNRSAALQACLEDETGCPK